MAAEMAAIPFRKRDADTAVVTGNFNSTKRGEKISPPPRPTMVRMKEPKKMITNKRKKGIGLYHVSRILQLIDIIDFFIALEACHPYGIMEYLVAKPERSN